MGVKGRLRSKSRLQFERLEARRVLATYFVDETTDFAGGTCGPNGLGNIGCNIRSAIEAATANPGPDTILIPAGTYLNDLGPLIIADGNDANDLSIAVDPASPGTVSIRRNSGFERVFRITAAPTTVVSMDGLTIEQGIASDGLGGGGIFSSANLQISNTSFIGNLVDSGASADAGAGANDGGAIQSFGPLNISNSSFTNNTAQGSGGAIDFTPNVTGAALTISNTDFTSNSAVVDGGALHVGTASAAGATVSITGGLFQFNSAGISGGGAYVANAGLSISGASFDSNLADSIGSFGGSGGGLYFQSNDGSHAFGLIGGGFDSNAAAGSGGGANFVNANGTISGTTFTNNSANGGGPGASPLTVGGGGFASSAVTIVPAITASNLLVDQNTASFGGGIALVATNLTIDNSTLSTNNATNSTEGGGGIGAFGLVDTPATINIQTSSISENTSAGVGGGLLAFDMNVTSSSNFSANTSDIDGGGIYVDETSNGFAVSLTGGTFDSNVASDSGGGVFVANADLTVSGVAFNANRADGVSAADGAGGGLYFFTADGLETFSITGGSFTSNQAAGGGGGASFENADGTISGTSFSLNTATLAGSPVPFENGGGGISSTAVSRVPSITASGITVDQNTAASGGGIGLVGTNFSLTGSTISNNTANNASEGGAGIGAVGASLGATQLTVGGTSTISGNTAQGEGGGIGVIDMDLTITSTNITGNTASSGRGGGIGILGALIEPTITLDTVVVDGNSAFSRGGGIYVGSDTLGAGFTPTVTVIGTTVSNNSVVDSSAGLAGGVFAPGQVNITDSVIRSNNAATAAGLYFGTGLNATDGSLSLTNTEISMNDALLSGGGVVIEPAVGVGPSATFTNSRILQNTATEQGGGLLASGMPLIFSGGEVSSNSTDAGTESDGGGLNVFGDLTISGTVFDSNSARDFGGAIIFFGGQLIVANATFNSNTAGDGGGALYLQSDTNINGDFDGVRFTGNQATAGDGGAVLTLDITSVALVFETSTFSQNVAGNFGGAVTFEAGGGSSLFVSRSTFNENTSVAQAGAVLVSGEATIENSTFSSNSASSFSGGGLFIFSGTTNVSHSTFTLNSADSAGGISVDSSGSFTPVANIANTIVAGNTANSLTAPDVDGPFNSLDGNLIGNVGTATGFNGASDQVGNSGSPIDPLLGPLVLQNPTDLTQTHALLPGSPAIDRAASGVSIAVDQRGIVRPQDGDGNRVFVADIGAFEAATLILLDVGDLVFADLDNNGLLDGNDFGLADVVLELYEDTDGSGDLDIATDTFVTSTLSLGDGSYSFQLIPPGDYIIVISESNYLLPGSLLEAYRTSTGNDPAPDPDNDINGDDNGTEVSGIGVVSGAFTLTVDGEPTNDGDTNPNTNLSIDFGFVPTLQVISDSDSVFLGEFVDIDVLLNDSTTVSNGVQLVSFTQPSLGLGTVTLNADNSLRFTTDPLVGTGSDSFTYTATDGTSTFTTSVFVDVQDNPNDRPADAIDDFEFTDEDVPLVFDGTIAILTDNDVPEIFAGSNQPLSISSVDPIIGVTQGTVTLNGQIATYTPPADFFGTDQFTYSLVGGDAPATVFVEVLPINDPPIAVSDSFSVFDLSGANNLNVLANDLAGPANESDQLLEVFEILTSPSLGTAVISPNGDSIIYTPNGSLGSDSFEYTIIDSEGLSSGPTLVSIEVLQSVPANAMDDLVSTDEDSSLNILASELLSNDNPGTGVFAGPPSIVSVDVIDGITVGTVTLNADNTIDYVPPADFFGTDQFTYSLSGGSSPATVFVDVSPVNDSPIVVSDFFSLTDPSGPVSLDVLQNDRPGPDNELDQTLQVFEITTSPSLGTATISPTGDSIIYTAFGSTGFDSFAYRIIDSESGISTSGIIDLEVSFSLPPVANDDVATTNEDNSLTLPSTTLLLNDVLGSGAFSGSLDIESANGISGVTLGTVTLNGDDSITYVPPADFFGTDRFTYSLVNGVAPATIVVTVSAVNDAPIANDDTFQVIGSGNSATLNVLNNDLPGPSNESNQTIRVTSIISPPSVGTAVISASGATISYLTSEALGSDTFTYEITDSEGLTSQATVTILIDSTLQITGLLTCDLNGNLSHDANEALVNREVFLDLNGNRAFDDAETLVTTDSNGRYRFPLAESGNYEVVTMIPSGCTTITPFPSTVRTAGVGNLARSLAVANFDGDSDLDLVVVSDLDGRVTELHNEDGQLTVTPRFTIGGRPQSIAVWQADNGSIPATTAVADAGTTADGGRILRIGPDQAIIPVPGGPFKVLLEDFDGDNKPEIIFSDYRNSSLRMIRGGTTEIIDLTAESGANVIGAAFGDFDADGNIDIAVAGDQFSASGTGGVRLLLGDGAGNFTLSEAIGFAGGVVDIATAELDDTAGDEILVLSSSGMLRTLSFDGTVIRQVSATPIEAGAASFVVGDFNGDNFQDVAIASTVKRSSSAESDSTIVQGKLEFLVGTTSGTFVPFTTTFSVDSPSDMVSVDLDGDGIDELAVTNLFQEISGPRGPQFVFPSTVTVFKLNVSVQSVTVVPGKIAEVDFVFASADPDVLLDVNRDNQLAPVDALIVMNALNRAGEGESSGYRPRYDTDVNRDGRTSPVDALIIINRLNRMSSGRGEGEDTSLSTSVQVGSTDWSKEAEKRRREQLARTADELWATEFDLFD